MDAAPQDFARVLSSMCTVTHPDARDAALRFLADLHGVRANTAVSTSR